MLPRILAALAVSALALLATSPESRAQPERRLTLVNPFNAGISFYPTYVAAERGFFKDEKLDVQIVIADASSGAGKDRPPANAAAAVTVPSATLGAAAQGPRTGDCGVGVAGD